MIVVNRLFVSTFPQNIEIPLLKITKKVKSMQMFHQPVQKAIQVSKHVYGWDGTAKYNCTCSFNETYMLC